MVAADQLERELLLLLSTLTPAMRIQGMPNSNNKNAKNAAQDEVKITDQELIERLAEAPRVDASPEFQARVMKDIRSRPAPVRPGLLARLRMWFRRLCRT